MGTPPCEGNELIKKEFRTERIQYLKSLGKPKSYQTMNQGVAPIDSGSSSSSDGKNNTQHHKKTSSHVVMVTPPVSSLGNNNNNNNKQNNNSGNNIEVSHSHSRSQSLTASYSSSWSDSSDNEGRLSLGQKNDWNADLFAQQIGIELSEVAQFLKSPKSKNVMEAIWDRVLKDPNQQKVRNSDEHLFKLTYAVIFSAAKAQDRTKQSIPKEPVKKVAKRLKKELSKGKRGKTSKTITK